MIDKLEDLEKRILELVKEQPGLSEQALLVSLTNYDKDCTSKICILLGDYASENEEENLDFRTLYRLNKYVILLAKEKKLKIKGNIIPLDDDHISDANVCVGGSPGIGYMKYYPIQ